MRGPRAGLRRSRPTAAVRLSRALAPGRRCRPGHPSVSPPCFDYLTPCLIHIPRVSIPDPVIHLVSARILHLIFTHCMLACMIGLRRMHSGEVFRHPSAIFFPLLSSFRRCRRYPLLSMIAITRWDCHCYCSCSSGGIPRENVGSKTIRNSCVKKPAYSTGSEA